MLTADACGHNSPNMTVELIYLRIIVDVLDFDFFSGIKNCYWKKVAVEGKKIFRWTFFLFSIHPLLPPPPFKKRSLYENSKIRSPRFGRKFGNRGFSRILNTKMPIFFFFFNRAAEQMFECFRKYELNLIFQAF